MADGKLWAIERTVFQQIMQSTGMRKIENQVSDYYHHNFSHYHHCDRSSSSYKSTGMRKIENQVVFSSKNINIITKSPFADICLTSIPNHSRSTSFVLFPCSQTSPKTSSPKSGLVSFFQVRFILFILDEKLLSQEEEEAFETDVPEHERCSIA